MNLNDYFFEELRILYNFFFQGEEECCEWGWRC